ncbi:MAG: S1C family serine protease, partial [Candidatus Dormibacteraeota bacterium]|nr:S1C family serine protease [Candidatus Dormibacteraeota bacterium]
ALHRPTASITAPTITVPARPGTGSGGAGSAGSGSGGALDLQSVVSRVSPAIVDINTQLASINGTTGQAAGTGMIVTSSGEVLTNNHVVKGAASIKVTVAGHDGSYAATVKGVDPAQDVALLQIQGLNNLPTVKLGNTSNLQVGQPVIAIGNALGQGGAPAVTQGTITGLDQSITAGVGNGSSEQLVGLIESNAPISPGDSGGALVNQAAQVVGMITAGSSASRRSTTSVDGFAVPASTAATVLDTIRSGHESGTVLIGPRGYLGVGVQTLDPAVASQLGASAGVEVTGVAPGSPAASAGITSPAVITAIDGQSISSLDDLGSAIQAHRPGDSISVTWLDRSGTHTAKATLVAGPSV